MNTALLSSWDHNANNLLDNKTLRINWHLGNTCTFKCSYCDPLCHDGSIPKNLLARRYVVELQFLATC